MDDSPQEQVGLQKPEVAARGPKKHQKGSDINWEEVGFCNHRAGRLLGRTPQGNGGTEPRIAQENTAL